MLSPTGAALLAVEGLQAWYGESHILHGANFDVFAGEVVTLLGRNGAGKTTTLKAVMGMVSQRTGSVRYDGTQLIGSVARVPPTAAADVDPKLVRARVQATL